MSTPKIRLFIVILLLSSQLYAAQIKNNIIMIPDGTSVGVLSLARWCQRYKDENKKRLAIDNFICGLVVTHSSNAPIGDSAPTGTQYSTGELSQTGFIAMYPPKDSADIIPVDAKLSYQPLLTILEVARLLGKKTGLVFTCEFPHATPAAFASHWYDRRNMKLLAKQMVYNLIDVVFGGGVSYCHGELYNYLISQGYKVLLNDITLFRSQKTDEEKKIWALFSENDMPFDLDRDPAKVPSLAEMTAKALRVLSKSENGFFLMVEGSKIDWAAHSNDPVGMYSEFLAFDHAVDTVMKFAHADSHTLVIICPDHGNSGISIGNHSSDEGYDKLSLKQICEPIVRCKLTAEGIADRLINGFKNDTSYIRSRFEQGAPGTYLSHPEILSIVKAYNKFEKSGGKDKDELKKTIANIITSRSFIGFTTQGHTGENVFLALFDPRSSALTGVQNGVNINHYMCEAFGLIDSKGNSTLKDSTKHYYYKYEVAMSNIYKRVNKDTIALWLPDSSKFLQKIADTSEMICL